VKQRIQPYFSSLLSSTVLTITESQGLPLSVVAEAEVEVEPFASELSSIVL
jgi:hypothetical protein